MSPGIVYPPVESVCTVRWADVAMFFAVMVASGTTPPVASRTVPEIVPVSAWPNARVENRARINAKYKRLTLGFIFTPCRARI